MRTQVEEDAGRVKTLSAKAAYLKAANRKLADTTRILAGVNSRIRNAVSTGRIDATDQFKRAQHAVELNLLSVEQHIDELRKADEQSWEACADAIDSAWEHLSQSLKQLVARFSDLTMTSATRKQT